MLMAVESRGASHEADVEISPDRPPDRQLARSSISSLDAQGPFIRLGHLFSLSTLPDEGRRPGRSPVGGGSSSKLARPTDAGGNGGRLSGPSPSCHLALTRHLPQIGS